MEVMVALVIVSIGLLLVNQGLLRARRTAAETHYRKVARELALVTLGRLESGLFWEELDGGGEVLSGTYAEEGYEDYHYELVLGDEEFLDDDASSRRGRDSGYHDSWDYEREREERLRNRERERDDEEDEEVAEPFEKARIKIVYPGFGEKPSELVLERWIPWEQVYGATDDEDGKKGAKSGGAGSDEP
jgi:hypothetical protein